jgi:hypothetical protein
MSQKNPPNKSPRQKIVDLENIRCIHTDALNRRCTGLRAKGKYGLCATHATEARQLREAESIAQELVGSSIDFTTTIAVNHTLGKLFKLTAANRIPQRHAALLAYIGQLLLNSTDNVKDEIQRVAGEKGWEGTVRQAIEVLNATACGQRPPEP